MDSEIQGLIALLQAYKDNINQSPDDGSRTWKQDERFATYESIQKTFQGTPLEKTIEQYLISIKSNPPSAFSRLRMTPEKRLIDAIIRELKDKQNTDNLTADAYALNLEEKVAQLKDSLTPVAENQIEATTAVQAEQQQLTEARKKIQERVRQKLAQSNDTITQAAQNTAALPPTVDQTAVQTAVEQANQAVASLPLSASLVEVERTYADTLADKLPAAPQEYVKASSAAAAQAFDSTRDEVYEEYRGKIPEAVNSATTRIIEHVRDLPAQEIYELNQANYQGMQALSEVSANTTLESAATIYKEAAANYLQDKNIAKADQYVEAMATAAKSELAIGQQQYGIQPNQTTDFHEASTKIVEDFDKALRGQGTGSNVILKPETKEDLQKRITSVLDSQTENGEFPDIERAQTKVRFELSKTIQRVEQDHPGVQVKVSSVDLTDTVRDSILDAQAQIINRKSTTKPTGPVDIFSASGLAQNPEYQPYTPGLPNPENQPQIVGEPIRETQAERVVRQQQTEWAKQVKETQEKLKKGEIDWPEYQRQVYSATIKRDRDTSNTDFVREQMDVNSAQAKRDMGKLKGAFEDGQLSEQQYIQAVQNIIDTTGDVTTVGTNIDRYTRNAEKTIEEELRPLVQQIVDDPRYSDRFNKTRKVTQKDGTEKDLNDSVDNIVKNIVAKSVQGLSDTQQLSDVEQIVNSTLRTELPNQLQQYGVTKFNDQQYDAQISQITRTIAQDQSVRTAATLASVKELIPYADAVRYEQDNMHKLSSLTQDKFWEQFKQSLSPQEIAALSNKVSVAMLGTASSPGTQGDADEIVRSIIKGALEDSGFTYEPGKQDETTASIQKIIANAQQKYAQSQNAADIDAASKEILDTVNASLMKGRGRSSHLSFLQLEDAQRIDLSAKDTLFEVAREDTQFEVEDTLRNLIPGLRKEQYSQLAKDAIATMYGRVYVEKIPVTNAAGEYVLDANGNPKFEVLGNDQNGYPIYKMRAKNSYGLLADFTERLSPLEQDKLKKMTEDERKDFFASLRDKHKEYVLNGAALTIFGVLKERGLLTAEFESKLNNLKLRDVYTPEQQAFLQKEGKVDLNRRITLQEALQIKLQEHGLHFDEFMDKMEDIELKNAERLSKVKSWDEKNINEKGLEMVQKWKAKNVFGKGIENAKMWLSPTTGQRMLSNELVNRPWNTVMWGMRSIGVSTQYSVPIIAFNLTTDFDKQKRYFNTEVSHFYRRTGIPVDVVLEKGYISDDIRSRLSKKDQRLLDRYIRESEAFKKVQQYRDKHKNFAKFTDWYTGKNRSYKATYALEAVNYMVHGNPGGLGGIWVGRIETMLTNMALEKAGWIFNVENQTYELPAWQRTKKKFKEDLHAIGQGIKNSKPVKAVKDAVLKMLGETVVKTVKLVTGAIGKVIGFLAKTLTVVLGVISAIDGVVQKVLDLIGLGGLYRKLKQLLKLYFTTLVYQLLSPLLTFFSWFSGSSVATTAVTTATPAASSLALRALPNAAGSIHLGMINPVNPFTLGWSTNIISGIQGMWAGLSNLSFAKLFALGQSSLVALFTWAGPLGFAGLTVFTFGLTTNYLFHLSLMNALKDPLDRLNGYGDVTSPIVMTKTANPPKALNTNEITYTINVKSPPCAPNIIVVDPLPATLKYVPGSIGAAKIPPTNPIITSITTNDSITTPTTQLKWIINIDPSKVQSSSCVTTITGGGDADIENSNSITEQQLAAILAPHNLKGKAPQMMAAAQKYNINPLLVVAIYMYESGLGDTGIGRPPGPTGGCFNPGNQRGGNSSCKSKVNGDFRTFANYDEAIDASFSLLRDYISNGRNTISLIVQRYQGTEDKRAEEIAIINCTVTQKKICSDEVAPGEVNFSGTYAEANLTFKATVNLDKGCINNVATVTAETVTNTATNVLPINDADCAAVQGGKPFPADKTEAEIIALLCNDYKVCPTVQSSVTDPTLMWTKDILEPLWNQVQRIYLSPSYVQHIIGNSVLEPTLGKTACNACSPVVVGYGFGLASDAGHKHLAAPNSRMIGFATGGVHRQRKEVNEKYFFPHEMGHIGAAGASDGSFPGLFGNPDMKAFLACKKTAPTWFVSKYPAGETSILPPDNPDSENTADAIAAYMTDSEKTIMTASFWDPYKGASGNLKTDYDCHYKALQLYFGGVEYTP